MTKFYRIIKLTSKNTGGKINLIIKNLPPDFELYASDRDLGGNTLMMLKISGDFEDQHKASEGLHMKIKKMRTYFAIIHPGTEIERAEWVQSTMEGDYRYPQKIIKLKELEDFFNKSVSEKERWLIEAINDFDKGNVFDSFQKLVNWLDDIEGKPATIYCSVRDNLSHLSTDGAVKKTKSNFPNYFEFEGKTIMKNKHNEEKLIQIIPDLIKKAQESYSKNFIKT